MTPVMNLPAASVLVVDDDDDVRALAVAILHEAGYRALPASSGDAALTLLRNGLAIDLLFTDIVMPGELDGFRLAIEARRIRPDLKIVYTTGFAGFTSRITAQMIPAPMLKKPYRPGELASAVMRALEDGPSIGIYAARA